jgi:hypothetical protein
MKRKWDAQWCWNPWLSLGFHFDHIDPSLTIHLPMLILSIGRLKQPGFRSCDSRRSLFSEAEPELELEACEHQFDTSSYKAKCLCCGEKRREG